MCVWGQRLKGLASARTETMRGGCRASGMGLRETAPRPGSGKGQGVTRASWLEDSKLGNSSLCSLGTPQHPRPHPSPQAIFKVKGSSPASYFAS